MTEPNTEEGKAQEEVKDPVDDKGQLPDMITKQQYIATKESLGGKLDKERARADSLEEKLKTAVKQEDVDKAKSELEEANKKIQELNTELSSLKETTLSEKKKILIGKGMPEDKVKDMTAEQIATAIDVLGTLKPPSPDLGGGGGGQPPSSGLDKIREGFYALHPR